MLSALEGWPLRLAVISMNWPSLKALLALHSNSWVVSAKWRLQPPIWLNTDPFVVAKHLKDLQRWVSTEVFWEIEESWSEGRMCEARLFSLIRKSCSSLLKKEELGDSPSPWKVHPQLLHKWEGIHLSPHHPGWHLGTPGKCNQGDPWRTFYQSEIVTGQREMALNRIK